MNQWDDVKSNVKGMIYLVHGFHEHSSRDGYVELAKDLNQLGYLVFSHDHYGHGKRYVRKNSIDIVNHSFI